MTINISEEDAQLFIKNGFSKEQVGETVNHYRSQGLSDEDIQSKLNARVAEWKAPQQPVQPQETPRQTTTQEKPVTPDMSSGTPTLYGNAEYVPTYEELDQNYKAGKLSKEELITQAQRRKDLDFKEADEMNKAQTTRNTVGGSLVGLGAVPLLNLPLTGWIGGGLTGAGLGIINQKPAGQVLRDTGIGAATGLLLGKLPVAAQAIGKTKVGQAISKKANDLAEKTVVKLSENNIGDKIIQGAEKVGEFLTKERTLPKIKMDKVLPKTGLNFKDIKNNIKANKFDNKTLKTIKGVNRKGRVWTEVLQNEDNGVIYSEREFNNIIDEIAKNPEKLRNPNYVNQIEAKVQDVINRSPYPNEEEFVNSFWDRYVKAVDEGMRYNELKYGKVKNNMFGGEFEQPSQSLPTETKQTKLTQTMKDAGTLPDELKNLNPEYEVLHNADIAAQATEAIKKDPNQVLGELQQKALNKDSELSALDFETARQTLSKLYQEGRVDEALALTDLISQKASKAGQSVQALSMWSKTTPEGAVRYAQKIISDYNKTAKNPLPLLTEQQANEIMELAKNTQLSEIGTRENNIANQLLLKYFKELMPASAGSKLRTLQNISLLLNPKTFLRNIVGNSIFAGMDTAVSKPIAAGIDTIASKFTGNKTRVLPRIKEYAQGLGQGFREGVEDVGLGINTRDKLGTRFNLNDRKSLSKRPIFNQKWESLGNNPVVNALETGAAPFEKLLNYSLQVPDRMFYQAAYNESIANQLKAAGLKEPTADMVKNATNEALEAVFQNNTKLGNAVLKARQSGNELFNLNGFGVGDAFLPYAQTPANIAVQGWNYSPLGFTNAVKNFRLGNQRQATLDTARALVGTGLGTTGFLLGKRGFINPEIEDKRLRDNYRALGTRPSNLNIGDYDISYNQIQPMAQPIAAGATLADVGEGDYASALDKAASSLTDLGMLQSLQQFMSDYKQHGPATATMNLLGSVPSRFVPSVLKQANDLIDPIQRDTYDRNPFKYGANQALAKVPGISKTLPAKYDITGQQIKKYDTEGAQKIFDIFANPIFVSKHKDDQTIKELINLYESTGEKSVLLPEAQKTITFKNLNGEKVRKELNTKELNEYRKALGQMVKFQLDNFVNSTLWNNLTDVERLDEVKKTIETQRNIVNQELLGKPNPDIVRELKRLQQKYDTNGRDKALAEVLKIRHKVLPVMGREYYDQNFK